MSLKLTLIASFATISVAGISTGSYFLLKGSEEKSEGTKQEPIAKENGDGDESGSPKTTGGQSDSKSASDQQLPPQSSSQKE